MQPARAGANSMLPRSPSGEWAQFHRHAPQWTHFSRSKAGAPSGPSVMAWPEHMAMQVFSSQAMQRRLVEKHDMIGEARHGLHLAAHQQRILMRDEQTAVEGNLRPAARGHQRIVQRAAVVHGQRRGLLAA